MTVLAVRPFNLRARSGGHSSYSVLHAKVNSLGCNADMTFQRAVPSYSSLDAFTLGRSADPEITKYGFLYL
jgi:hypothetical protein